MPLLFPVKKKTSYHHYYVKVNPQILFIPVSILPTHAIIEGLPATAVAKFNPKYAYIYLPLLLQKLIQNTLRTRLDPYN